MKKCGCLNLRNYMISQKMYETTILGYEFICDIGMGAGKEEEKMGLAETTIY